MKNLNLFAMPFKPLLEMLLAFLIGASIVLATGWLICLNQVHVIFYRMNGLNLPATPWRWGIPALGALLLPVIALRQGNFSQALIRLNRMLFPALLAPIAILIAPNSYWTALFLVFVTGIVAYRAGVAWFGKYGSLHCFRASWRSAPYVVIVLYLFAVLWGYYLQCRAYDSMYLYYSDWGEYSENYLRLAFGENRRAVDFLAVGGHWNFAVNIIMTVAIWLYPHPNTIFLINAIVIFSAMPLGYALARAEKLPTWISLICVAIAFFNPVIANQPLALVFGFHPINFMIPTILGFFICRAKKQVTGMIILFILSLLIQETVAVFWSGYALYLLVKRRYIAGIALFSFCVLLFLLLSLTIIPHLFGSSTYTQIFHYSNLGTTPKEVILSPFLRFSTFLQVVLQWQNLAFAAGLLAPVWLAVLVRPQLAIVALPLLAGICIQDSAYLKNLAMWCGIEITTLLFAIAILNVATIRNGAFSQLLKIAGYGIASARHRTARTAGLVCSLFLCSAIIFTLLGLYSWKVVRNQHSGSKVLRYLFNRLPESGRILATQRLRVHALFERKVASEDAELQPGDIVMLDLHDPSIEVDRLEKIRRKLVERQAVPIASANWYGNQLVCFVVEPSSPLPAKFPPCLRIIEDEEFNTMGQWLPDGGDDFELRVQQTRDGKALLLVRLRHRIEYDVDLNICTWIGEKEEHMHLTFAYGLFPAYAQPEHQVFLLPLPGKFPERISVDIVPRPESGTASKAKK